MKKLFPLALTVALALTTTAFGADITFTPGTVTEITLSEDWSSDTITWDDANVKLGTGASLTLPTATVIADIPFKQISGDGFVKVDGYSYNTSGNLIRFSGLDFTGTIPENDYFTWENNTLTIKKDTDITGTLTLPADATLVLNADLQVRNYDAGKGIDAKGDLKIDGEGLLTVDTEDDAIYVAGNLTTYAGIQGHLTSRGGNAITATGKVTMTSPNLYLGAWGHYGIEATGDILIGGMKTDIEDLSLQGIKATGNITIDAGAQVSAYTVAGTSITVDGAGTALSAVPYTLDTDDVVDTYPMGYLTQTPSITNGATFNGWVRSGSSGTYTYTLYGTTTFVPKGSVSPETTTLVFTAGATIDLSTWLYLGSYHSVTTESGKSIYDYLIGDGFVIDGNEVHDTNGTLIGYSVLDFTTDPDYTAKDTIEDTEGFYTWTKSTGEENNTLTIRKAMTMASDADNCLTLPANTTLVLAADLTLVNDFSTTHSRAPILGKGDLTVKGAGDLSINSNQISIKLENAGTLTVSATGTWNLTSSEGNGIECFGGISIEEIGGLTIQSKSTCISGYGDVSLTLTKPATLTSSIGSGITGGGTVEVDTDSTLTITTQSSSDPSIYGKTGVTLFGYGTLNVNTHISSQGTVTVPDTLTFTGWTQSSLSGTNASSARSTHLDVYGNAVIPYSGNTQKITDTVTFHNGASLTISQGQIVNFAHVDTFVGDVTIINNGILKLAPAMEATETFANISGSGYLWFAAGTDESSNITAYNNCTTVTDCSGNAVKAVIVGTASDETYKRFALGTTEIDNMSANGYTWTADGTTYTLTFADDVDLVLNVIYIPSGGGSNLSNTDSIIINVPSDLATNGIEIGDAMDTTAQGDGSLTVEYFTQGNSTSPSTLTINTPITAIGALSFDSNVTINAPVTAPYLSVASINSHYTLAVGSTGSLRLTGESVPGAIASTLNFSGGGDAPNDVPGLRLGEGIEVQEPTNADVQVVPDSSTLLVMNQGVRPNAERSNSANEIYIAPTPAYTPSSGTSTYSSKVASTENGTVSISASKSAMNTTVTITATPDDGYVVGDVTVTYASGREVTVTDNGDGTYSYIQPGAAVTVTVTFVDPDAVEEETTTDEASGFTDVDPDAYYYDAMLWALEKGITTGYSDDTFRSTTSATRAQVVTFLWRAAGEPEWDMCYPYADVDADAWYVDAVYWATVNGIASGYGDETFRANSTCTRGQIVTFLWRMAGCPVVEGETLSDVDADAYYYDAVLWAVSEGITTGYADGTFQANTLCNRGQIVTFLYRYLG